jgi:uncharacterized protein
MIERRIAPVELRTEGRRLVGYAARFDSEAKMPGFTERIRPGAFADSLRSGADILALVDHDATKVLARTRSKTLSLVEDANGLAFAFDVPDTGPGRDVLALAQRGDLGGMSFGFTIPTGGDHWDGTKRELRAVNLIEISIVTAWPAYEGTSVAARSRFPQRLSLARRYLETV